MALVCLAGRQSIPHGLYEAAKIDGGNAIQIFRRITFPLMLPFVGIGITSTSVTAVNVFDEIVALSGYSDIAKNILMESYLTTFTFLDFGKGSAVTYLVMFFALSSCAAQPVMAGYDKDLCEWSMTADQT